ncbi:MAG: ribonuclease III [Synechococcales cyanobacterium]
MLPHQRQQRLTAFVSRLGMPTMADLRWDLIDQALTHPSAHGSVDNDRLEFLGDAVLRLAVTDFLWSTFPQASPGELTALRGQLTSDAFLTELASHFHLERELLVGTVDDLGRPRRLADAWEALLGALYLSWASATLPRLRQWLDPQWHAQVRRIQRDPARLNPKAALQEYTQGRWTVLPDYRLVEQSGTANAPQFRVQVWIQGRCWGEGVGSSKKMAEAQAASLALQTLGSEAGSSAAG